MKVILRKCSDCPSDSKLKPAWKTIREDGEKKYLCRYHAQMRTAKKQIAEKKKEGSVSDKLDKWYKFIYDKYEGYCQETGRKLDFNKRYCAHLLPKAKYPYFKLDPRNGLLLNWQTHSILDHGSPNQRKALKVWNQISETRRKLLDEVGMEYDEEFWLNMST